MLTELLVPSLLMVVVTGPWKVKCNARSKRTGKECSNWAVIGSPTCRMHSGQKQGVGVREQGEETLTPAQRTARGQERMKARLAELGDIAVKTVQEILESSETRATDRLRAAEMVMDRFVPKKSEVEVTQHEALDLDAEIEEALGEAPMQSTGTDDE